MSLIDRYIAEVGRHLPEKDRSDIEAEIRSTLEDMIEEREHQGESSSEDEIVVETIEQFGDPQLLANKYAPPKHFLIGPSWYEGYMIVLQRVLLTALPVVAVVMFFLSLTKNPTDLLLAVGQAIGGVYYIGLQIWFWTTLVFFYLERSGETPHVTPGTKTEAWTVARLPELPKKRQISIAETVTNIVGIVLVLIFTAWAFILFRLGEIPEYAAFLHPKVWSLWLPLLFVIMGLTLIQEVFKLIIGNWTRVLTTTNVILCLISIAYFAAFVLTQDLINPAFMLTLKRSMTPSELNNLVTWGNWTINITTVIIIGLYARNIVHSIQMAKRFELERNEGDRHEPDR